ncbi:hypothetical protein GJU39_07695 [Pedobacter petrophilus]|uniref:Lipoprotein n=1 Tax=Pedobacter petrophilus TaxID=1908241 RepID=A0A7K0FYC1_9SPHI|nr:hypothetical protein [Pedobacter petrophilus]MRX75969.1 hypothetical protein [Pedobacter petrophilus]
MRKFSLPALTCFILLIGCQSNDKKDNAQAEFKNVNQLVTKSFSDLNAQDTFKIELTGRKPEDMVLTFNIRKSDGKEIYNVKIKGTDLLGSTDPNVDLSKEKDQITFLKTIAGNFFSEDNFLEPAVMRSDKPDDYVPDKAFYEELKKSRLNGFKYRLGKENNMYIAWSEKEQKVKIYYNCC